MSITVTVAELVNAKPGLEKLAQAPKLPFKASYDCAKLIKLANVDLSAFGDAKEKLIAEYGVLDEDGKTRTVPEDKREAFFAEFEPVFKREVTFPVNPIKLPAELDSLGMTAADLLPLLSFVEVEGNGSADAESKKTVD
jgi:hypothetical protein